MSGSFLLDTHALLWSRVQPEHVSARAAAALSDDANTFFVSAVSGYEIALKHTLGKLPVAAHLLADLDGALLSRSVSELPVRMRHAVRAGELPTFHRDPFDRILAAQAIAEGLTIISADTAFDRLGVPRLW